MIACLANNGDEGGLKKRQRFDIETHDQMGKKIKKILVMLWQYCGKCWRVDMGF